MTEADNFLRVFNERILHSRFEGERKAILGKPDGTIRTDDISTAKVWVHEETSDGITEYAAWNINPGVNTQYAGVAVRIGENADGEAEIRGAIGNEAEVFLGSLTPSIIGGDPPTTEVMTTRIAKYAYSEGRLSEDPNNLLEFFVRELVYRDTAGVWKRWNGLKIDGITPDPAKNIDLSASVPGTSNQHALVVIALDNDATTPALASFVSAAQSTAISFTDTDIGSLVATVSSGFIVCGAVRLANGDAGTTLLDTSRFGGGVGNATFGDPRQFLAPVGGQAGVRWNRIEITANHTASITEYVNVDSTSGTVAVTLPAIGANNDGQSLVVRWRTGANAVSLVTTGGDTINGSTGFTFIAQKTALMLVADDANNDWMVS
jgi:hypothetical protein